MNVMLNPVYKEPNKSHIVQFSIMIAFPKIEHKEIQAGWRIGYEDIFYSQD